MQRNRYASRFFTTILITIFLVGNLPPAARAQDIETPKLAPATSGLSNSISQILNPDGTVNLSANITNSINAKGYRMEYTSSGAPRFVPEGPGSSPWDSRFGKNGFDGVI